MIRGLIFDFDGLILDTELPDFESWQEMFVEHGAALPLAAWTPLIGTAAESFDIYDYLEQQADRPIDRADVRERRRKRYHERVMAQMILPGVEACIQEAKRRGMKVGLASASSPDWVLGHLSRLGLHVHFDTVKTAADVARVKPDPALYRAALAALGLDAHEAIALEDSPNGIAAAKAAGLFCVAIPNAMTRDLDVSAADLRLNSLAEMPLTELLAIAESRIPHKKTGKEAFMQTSTRPQPEIIAFVDPIVSAIERIIRCLDGLDTRGLNWRPPAQETNSLYVLAVHTMANAEEFILGLLAGEHIVRDRDAEFAAVADDSAAKSVRARWADLQVRLRHALSTFPASVLEKTITHSRRGELSGRATLILVAQHACEHVGHAELTRQLLDAAMERERG